MRLLTCLMLFISCGLPAAASTIRVQRCVDAAGTISYQQLPCAAGHRHGELLLPGDRAGPPPVVAARPASRRDPAPRQPRRAAAAPVPQASTGPGRSPKPRRARVSSCPPTSENPGFLHKNSVKLAWWRYKSLPSRTYLKNAGRWPSHCPD